MSNRNRALKMGANINNALGDKHDMITIPCSMDITVSWGRNNYRAKN
jgi:hypothetical protein